MKAKKTTKKTTTKRATTSVASRGRGVRMLFATDGSPGAAAALDLLATLPLRPVDEVTVVMYPAYFLATRPDGTGLIGRLMEGRRKAAQSTVDAAVQRLAGLRIRVRGVVAQGLEAVDGILRVVTERSPDLIVMGSRGLGPVGSTVIGSTARTLALLSPVPVLIVRDRRTAPRRVLIAVDGSPASRAALAAFTRIPLPSDVEVELLHVLPAHDWSGLPVRGKELAELREEQERAESEAADPSSPGLGRRAGSRRSGPKGERAWRGFRHDLGTRRRDGCRSCRSRIAWAGRTTPALLGQHRGARDRHGWPLGPAGARPDENVKQVAASVSSDTACDTRTMRLRRSALGRGRSRT